MNVMAGLMPEHFLWEMRGRVAVIRLNRPERKNPLTFESYAELRDCFRGLAGATDVDVVVLASNGGNFCSGGDVHDIIGPLIGKPMAELLAFTRMTGDLVKAMLTCGKPVIAAVDGVAVGAGAILAMAADLRLATPEAKCAFLFTRVGLAGCDMGACAMLPRIIGQGRAAELLYTGRTMSAAEGERWGFWNALHPAEALEAEAMALAERLASGPTFAHGMTKTQLLQEWDMGVLAAIEAEAQAQAICMQTEDFERAYLAFVAKEKPVFGGNCGMRGPAPAPPGYLWTDEMSDESFLSWPFFEAQHRALAKELEAWASAHLPVDHGDVDAACRGLVAALGAGGWLQHSRGEALHERNL